VSRLARAAAVLLLAALWSGIPLTSDSWGAQEKPGSGAPPTAAQPAPTQPTITPSPAAPKSGAPKPAAPKPKLKLLRYRVVGCRSYGQAAYFHGPPRKEVAIGFDDGPAVLTPAFVRMLEANHVRATFFLIGEQVTSAYRATLLRELRDGDVLGDHSFTHPDLALSGGVSGQLSSALKAIRAQSGYTPCVFRPPYGAYDEAVVSAARALGMATIIWNVDPTDWALPGTQAIEQRVLAQVQPGSIILSHDGGGPRSQTLAAYPSIIRRLRARGYRIVTIPELLGFRPVYGPCIRLCEGIGEPRRELPRDAIIEPSRR
jgi:peptidoglycan/xylan/chitin deacetylase (PgdA/CDA1 family)